MTQFAMHVEGKATHLLFPKTLIWNKFFGYLVSILKPPHSTSNFSIGQNFGYQGKMWISCNHMVFNQPAVDEFFFFKQTLRHSFHDWLELHDVSIRQLFKYSLHVFEHNILLSFFPRIFFHLIYNMNLDISFSHQHHNILHKEYPFTWLMLCYVISYMCNSL